MLEQERIRARRRRPGALGDADHMHGAKAQVPQGCRIEDSDAAPAKFAYWLLEDSRRVARFEIVAHRAAEHRKRYALGDRRQRLQIVERIEQRNEAVRVLPGETADVREVLGPRRDVFAPGGQIRVQLIDERAQRVDAIGDARHPLEVLLLRLRPLLSAEPIEPATPLLDTGDHAGLARVALPFGRAQPRMAISRRFRDARLGEELHHLPARKLAVGRKVDQRQQPKAERVGRE